MTRLHGHVPKIWGNENIFTSTDLYCGKFLNFNTDAKFSMHFHAEKDETWYVMSGRFIVQYIDTINAQLKERYLEVGDTWHNPPLLPHRLICVEEGSIIEVSTPDSVEDNYRVMPGDSQKENIR